MDPVNGADVLMVDDLLSTGGDNTFRTHTFDTPQFVYGIEFAFSSSGAIDNLVLETPDVAIEVPVSSGSLSSPAPIGRLIRFCIARSRRRFAIKKPPRAARSISMGGISRKF